MVASYSDVIAYLADLICAVERPHPIRVAIDGVDAAGKTTLADALVSLIDRHDRPVIRASVDGFHNSREVRYRQGTASPIGYYQDSFNYEVLLRELLIPLGPSGDRKYRRAAFNYEKDAPAHEAWRKAPSKAILLFDGIFLLRPAIIEHWDFSIFLDIDFDISVPRAVARDVPDSEDPFTLQTALAKYNHRYVPGQKIYLAEARPKEKANVIVINNDWSNPRLIVRAN